MLIFFQRVNELTWALFLTLEETSMGDKGVANVLAYKKTADEIWEVELKNQHVNK